MTNKIKSDTECPHCGSADTELWVQLLYTVGDEEPQDVAVEGAKCRECGMQYVTEEVREEAREVTLEDV